MTTAESQKTVQTLHIAKEVQIAAPIEVVFETILEPGGPLSAMALKLEPWPGGRWFRDLGDNTGHLWGHVQVIKPPTLIELCGPFFMSYPALNFIQYRLTAEGAGGRGTKLALTHQAVGAIPSEHREGVHKGWDFVISRIRDRAQR